MESAASSSSIAEIGEEAVVHTFPYVGQNIIVKSGQYIANRGRIDSFVSATKKTALVLFDDGEKATIQVRCLKQS